MNHNHDKTGKFAKKQPLKPRPFQIGDRVRLLVGYECGSTRREKGSTGRVSGAWSTGEVHVRWDEGGYAIFSPNSVSPVFGIANLELLEPTPSATPDLAELEEITTRLQGLVDVKDKRIAELEAQIPKVKFLLTWNEYPEPRVTTTSTFSVPDHPQAHKLQAHLNICESMIGSLTRRLDESKGRERNAEQEIVSLRAKLADVAALARAMGIMRSRPDRELNEAMLDIIGPDAGDGLEAAS